MKFLNKKLSLGLALLLSAGLSFSAIAGDHGHGGGKAEAHAGGHEEGKIEKDLVKAMVKNLLTDNKKFMKEHTKDYFAPFQAVQKPRATVVTCSDSRVHTHAFDKTPDSDLFMVRDIGNQISTAEGSVEYGVHHLHTPLLIIVGHTACGAINAASGDYSKESTPIKRELDTIKIPKGIDNLSGVKQNVDNQVSVGLRKFEEEVKEGKLTVIGAVYDFKNEMGKGQGKLEIINVNGQTDPIAIKKFVNGALSYQ